MKTKLTYLELEQELKILKEKTSLLQEKQERIIKESNENENKCIVAVRDISKCKEDYKKTKESEKKYKTLMNDVLETSSVGVFVLDSNFKIIWINKATEVFFGFQRKNIIGKDKRELINKNIDLTLENSDIFKKKLLDTYHDNTYIETFECHMIPAKNRADRWLRHWSQPIKSGLYKGGRIEHYTDITFGKTTRAELSIAKKKAEESSRLKTEFLDNISHEIRTPLNGILGFSSILSKPGFSEEKGKEFIDLVKSSSNQLIRIINDILEISKLGTKLAQVKNTKVSLNEMFAELFLNFDIFAKEQEIKLHLKKGLTDKESIIFTDKLKLRRTINSLLINALKFTKKGFVEFGYRLIEGNEYKLQEEANLQIYVKDTGIGIKQESQEEIFDSFSQEEKGITRKVGGLGLGLAIAKENIKLLGGTITVESKKGKGSMFLISIPYKPVFKKKNTQLEKEKYNILIVEDEEVVSLYIETILQYILRLNCNIHQAKNGKEAIELCAENKNIDLVLMDIKMAVIDGLQATKQIKTIRPNLPIIAQTAYSTKRDRDSAKAAGCEDLISKPLTENVLKRITEKYLSNKTKG